MILDKLKSEGYDVRVTHLRRWIPKNGGSPVLSTRNQIISADGNMEYAMATGGETKVEVTSPDGRKASAFAVCSDKDNFNRKIGLNIAVGRALSKL